MSDELFTTTQIAERTGRLKKTVSKIAKERGIGRKLGRDWVFTAAEVEEIEKIDRRGGRLRRDGSPRTYTKPTELVTKGRRPRSASSPDPDVNPEERGAA